MTKSEVADFLIDVIDGKVEATLNGERLYRYTPDGPVEFKSKAELIVYCKKVDAKIARAARLANTSKPCLNCGKPCGKGMRYCIACKTAKRNQTFKHQKRKERSKR